MRTRHLGTLSGPVLLYGGPYSNIDATRALLDEADARAIPCCNRICTGDVVAYAGAPAQTVDLIRARGGAVVAGNCERQLGDGADGCGCGFAAGSTCDRLSAGWYAFADAQIDVNSRAWMRDLPDVVTFTHAARRVAVIHGGASDIARFLWSTSPEAEFAQEIAILIDVVGDIDMVIAGHSGIAFTRQIGPVAWVNAGVIGMPPHQGTPQTQFAILEANGVTIHSLTYDTARAVARMQAAGLVQGYDTALRTGWWPSEDVLPDALKRGYPS